MSTHDGVNGSMASCAHEEDLVRLAVGGQWPTGADEALRRHVETCPTCADVVRVTAWLGQDAMSRRATVSVPAAGQIWWRAAVRARLDATEAAARSLMWLHVASGVVLLAALVMAAPFVAQWVGPVASAVLARWLPQTEGLVAAVGSGTPWWLVAAAGASAIGAPIAVYLAVHDE